MDTYNAKRSMAGRSARANGQLFENMIIDSARFYESRAISVIDKTPEPVRIIGVSNRNKGQFIACFEKKAQPDFKGILQDSTMILFDAKHTDKDRIRREVVTDEQEKCFERYMYMGAMCFLVVSLGFRKYYRVPWVVFRDMKKIYGHAYMGENELSTYKINYTDGVLRFLDGVELKEGGRESEDHEVRNCEGN